MGPAPARGEHLGDPRPGGEARRGQARHEGAAGQPGPAGAACRRGGQAMSAVGHPDLVVKLPAWRARLLLGLLLAWLAVLAGRSFYLQSLNHGFLQQKGESRYSRVIDISATRGKIVDRHNEPLAISTPVESVAASPADVEMTREQAQRLSRLLNLNAADLKKKLADTSRQFAYLKRQIPPDEAARVVALGIPG